MLHCNGSTVYGQTAYPTGTHKNIIYTPSWFFDNSGTYTYTRMVAGCHSPGNYNDEDLYGIGIYATEISSYPCTPLGGGTNTGCYKNWVNGHVGHRGGTVQSSKIFSTWINKKRDSLGCLSKFLLNRIVLV